MPDDSSEWSRRRLLELTGGASLVGLSGCTVFGDYSADTSFGDLKQKPEDQHKGKWEGYDLDQPVPEEMETCVSQEGIERDPNDLTSKEDAAYVHHAESYQLCANCAFFCPSETKETVGACTEVEGLIQSQHWCALWEPAGDLEREIDPTSHSPR